jgi:hypothetical protein
MVTRRGAGQGKIRGGPIMSQRWSRLFLLVQRLAEREGHPH